MNAENERFVREAECRDITGLSRTTRWRLERTENFPKRRQISDNAVGWLFSELRTWLDTRQTGKIVVSAGSIARFAAKADIRPAPPPNSDASLVGASRAPPGACPKGSLLAPAGTTPNVACRRHKRARQ
jgi:prophage regulatory protein